MSLNIHVKSQIEKKQTGVKTKEWNIKKDISKSSNFFRYCNRTAYLYLCVDKTEGVHREPAGIYALYRFFSWRMFFQIEVQEEENGK